MPRGEEDEGSAAVSGLKDRSELEVLLHREMIFWVPGRGHRVLLVFLILVQLLCSPARAANFAA